MANATPLRDDRSLHAAASGDGADAPESELLSVQERLDDRETEYIVALTRHFARDEAFAKDVTADQRRIEAELKNVLQLPGWEAEAQQLAHRIADIAHSLPKDSPTVRIRITMAMSDLSPTSIPENDQATAIGALGLDGIFRHCVTPASQTTPPEDMTVRGGMIFVLQLVPPLINSHNDNRLLGGPGPAGTIFAPRNSDRMRGYDEEAEENPTASKAKAAPIRVGGGVVGGGLEGVDGIGRIWKGDTNLVHTAGTAIAAEALREDLTAHAAETGRETYAADQERQTEIIRQAQEQQVEASRAAQERQAEFIRADYEKQTEATLLEQEVRTEAAVAVQESQTEAVAAAQEAQAETLLAGTERAEKAELGVRQREAARRLELRRLGEKRRVDAELVGQQRETIAVLAEQMASAESEISKPEKSGMFEPSRPATPEGITLTGIEGAVGGRIAPSETPEIKKDLADSILSGDMQPPFAEHHAAAEGHAPEAHATADHAPEDHAPEAHATADHAPEDHAPEAHATADHAPEDHAPEAHATADHAPEDHASEAHATADHAPEDHASEGHAAEAYDAKAHGPEKHEAKAHEPEPREAEAAKPKARGPEAGKPEAGRTEARNEHEEKLSAEDLEHLHEAAKEREKERPNAREDRAGPGRENIERVADREPRADRGEHGQGERGQSERGQGVERNQRDIVEREPGIDGHAHSYDELKEATPHAETGREPGGSSPQKGEARFEHADIHTENGHAENGRAGPENNGPGVRHENSGKEIAHHLFSEAVEHRDEIAGGIAPARAFVAHPEDTIPSVFYKPGHGANGVSHKADLIAASSLTPAHAHHHFAAYQEMASADRTTGQIAAPPTTGIDRNGLLQALMPMHSGGEHVADSAEKHLLKINLTAAKQAQAAQTQIATAEAAPHHGFENLTLDS